jgi:hypothetical protein
MNTINTFTDTDQCIDFVTDRDDQKVFMIISDMLYQNIGPLIHDTIQFHIIFILSKNKIKREQWTQEWHKIKDIFTEISFLCKSI